MSASTSAGTREQYPSTCTYLMLMLIGLGCTMERGEFRDGRWRVGRVTTVGGARRSVQGEGVLTLFKGCHAAQFRS